MNSYRQISATFLLAVGMLTTGVAHAQEPLDVPVRDAETAIEIAREVCRDGSDPTLHWSAQLDGFSWLVTSEVRKSGDPMWLVIVPVLGGGPSEPLECGQSLYSLIVIKDNDEGDE